MSFTPARFTRQALGTGDPTSERTERPDDEWAFARVTSHERAEAEHFIRTSFIRAYGAHLTRFFPLLMSLRRQGKLLAACGLRYARVEPLFLETYLESAIEVVLSAVAGESITRAAVIEVGNLAVARAGIARQLIVRLTSHLHQDGGASWVVFSAVPSLRNNFVRLGIPLVPLAPADRNRLARGAQKEWGTYYDAAPQVTAVRVAAAHAALVRTACIR
jgi:hypothetical protein